MLIQLLEHDNRYIILSIFYCKIRPKANGFTVNKEVVDYQESYSHRWLGLIGEEQNKKKKNGFQLKANANANASCGLRFYEDLSLKKQFL